MASTLRSDQEWLDHLRSPGPLQQAALDDLRQILRRGLPFALAGWLDRDDPRLTSLVDDSAQEALLRILDRLDTFAGRSRFTTWANKVALRLALSELRRHRWKDRSLEEMVEVHGPAVLGGAGEKTERSAERSQAGELIEGLIQEHLTDRQRQALVAVALRGAPMELVAERMGLKRNALYKLIHDARRNLRRQLQRRGYQPEDLLELFDEG